MERHLGERGGRLEEVLGHCCHITVTELHTFSLFHLHREGAEGGGQHGGGRGRQMNEGYTVSGRLSVDMSERSWEICGRDEQQSHVCGRSPVGESRRLFSSSRFQNHRNLQLCFINNSDSDEDEEGTNKKVIFFKDCCL